MVGSACSAGTPYTFTVTLDLTSAQLLAGQPWRLPSGYWPQLSEATADLSAPVLAVCADALAEQVLRRPGFALVGIMSYEAQIAGVGDRPIGKPAQGALMRLVQARSAAELAERRASAVSLVREIANLEFVNGGGTG